MKAAQKELFLRELAVHGIVRRAALAAAEAAGRNVKSGRGAARAFYDERARDSEFAAKWDEAVEESGAAIEAEVHRRGVEGFEEQRVDSSGKVHLYRRYSDPCLLALARARLPAFRKSDVELTGRVEQLSAEDQKLAAEVRKLAAGLAGDKKPTVEHLAAAINQRAAEQADAGAAVLAKFAEDVLRDV